MANLGSIAKLGLESYPNPGIGQRMMAIRGVINARLDKVGFQFAKDASVGGAGAPSLRMDTPGCFKFNWTVASGSRSLSVSVKQAVNSSPRPRVTLKANAGIGVSSDVQSSAGSGTGFVTVTASCTPSSDGVIEVWLENLLDSHAGYAPCYWDDISAT